jgi:hypothetical protein
MVDHTFRAIMHALVGSTISHWLTAGPAIDERERFSEPHL